jgi:dTDP-4-dehydrorhamnose 3,5-epimerase
MRVFAGVHSPVLVRVPPLVWHGFKCVSEDECVVMNVPTEVFNREEPDELRREAHDPGIPFDWARRDK